MSITGSNNPFACNPVVFANANSIVSLGTITRDGNEFTFSVGFVWKINGVTYQNTAPVVITIAEASEGFNRIDNALLNTSNTIELQQGLESDTIALRPVAPETNIILTSWNISGTTIGDAEASILGTQFKKKSESAAYNDPTLSGSDAVIQFQPNGESVYAFSNAGLVSIDGFGLDLITGNPSAETPYPYKDLFIFNNKSGDLILKHDGSGTAQSKFFFIDETDLIIPPGGKVWLKYGPSYCEMIFKSWSEAISTSTFIVKDLLVATNLATTWRFRNYASGTSYTPTVLDSGQTNFLTALTGGGGTSIPYQTHSSYIAPFDTKLKSIQVIITNVFAESANINLGFGTHLKTDGETTVTDGVSILQVEIAKNGPAIVKKKYTTADFGDVTILSGHSLVVGWINQGRGVEIYFEMEKA